MKKIIVTLTFVVSFVSFGQNDFKLGNTNVLIKNGILFKYKTPLSPFTNEEESYSSDGNNNLVTAYYARTSEHIVALQIYAITIPPKYKNFDWKMINSSINQQKFINSFLGAANNTDKYISNYKVITINGKVFLEVQSTLKKSGVIQKQINWITVYKNNFINILGSTLLNSFDNNLPFFTEFSHSIFID
jgi:hypothetical protein